MLRNLIIGAVLAASLSTAALAQGQVGTAAEAKSMMDKAITELKANEGAALYQHGSS